MHLLLTRPAEDAGPLANRLRDGGHDVMLAPLLAIRAVDDPGFTIEGVQAILLTSANGARALARAGGGKAHLPLFGLPVFAVGNATARAASELGFTTVKSASGDVPALAELAANDLTPDAGALLHVAGTRVAGDLAGLLGAQGFDVRRAVLYEAETPKVLPENCATALAQRELDGALFFSPRTAATFARLVSDAGLATACDGMTAYCLSQAVADAIGGLPWRRITVAGRPDQKALLAQLENEDKHERA